jgi:hypothetical protein
MWSFIVATTRKGLWLLGIAVPLLLLFATSHPYLRRHFFNLLIDVWHLFIQEEGTTGPGFASNILWPLISLGVAWYLIRKERGKVAAERHLKEEAKLAARVIVIVALIIYGPMALWCIVRTVYDDHHNMASRWQAVVNEKEALKVGLTERDRYIKTLENGEKDCPKCKTVEPGSTSTQELPNISWTQEQSDLSDGKPTVTVLFRVDAALNLPAFVAICDRPCKPIYAEAGPMSHRRDITWLGRSDLAGVFFDIPKPLPTGTSCKLRIVSADNTPVKIVTFRILKEIEIPLELR